jgi:hypothetical protein
MTNFLKSSLTTLLIIFSYSGLSIAADNESDIELFRRNVNIDTVSKILSYTEGLEEGGKGDSFWYVHNAKECIYRKASIVELKVASPPDNFNADGQNNTNSINTSSQYIFDTNVKELKLNSWVPSTVRVGYVQNAGTWWGPNNYFLQIMANGVIMLESSQPRDLNRTKAAWDQIFNKFCPGTRNYF